MDRRNFVGKAGLGALAATTLAAPAIAQSNPEVKWRLTSSFPKSLDILWGAAEMFSKALSDMSDGKFQVRNFAAGEIVPALQVADAVQNGTVECGHTAAYYFFGKDPSFVFETGLPFSMNTRQYMAWLKIGGGHELMQEFYKQYGLVSFSFGNTGAQMGGWFRKEINSVDDMKGLKFRSGGFAGLILAKMGVVPQQIAPGDIYAALEKGTIDGCELVGPYDDEKIGLNKVAKYYYYPGWWEGAASTSLYVGTKAWEALPPAYKKMVEIASAAVSEWTLAKYDAGNPAALKRLVAGGTVLKAFPRAVMEASFDTTWKYYDEVSAQNPGFKKIMDSLVPFRADQNLWFRVAEFNFDSFNFAMSARGR